MRDQRNLNLLPKGWVWTTVGDIAYVTKLAGFEFTKYFKYQDSGDVRVIRGLNVGHGVFKATDFKYIESSVSDALPRSQLRGGELLVAYVGTLGTAAILPTDGYRYHLGPNVCKVVIDQLINDARFLLHYFISSSGQYLISSTSKAVAQSSLSMQEIRLMDVPLAPLPEQHRIVTKLEELFTRLDAGVEDLQKIKLQLKRYRQSVLKAAFEGKLTAKWRDIHKGEQESAAILLEQAKAVRQKKLGGKYTQLSHFDISALPELPEGWLYLSLDYLVSSDPNSIKRGPFGSAIKKSCFVPSGYKVYEQSNVIYSDFTRGSYFISEYKFNEMKGFAVRPGDILMSCSGTVGKLAIVPKGIQQGIINQALLKISLDISIVNTKYFVYLFRSQIDDVILNNTRGSAMVNISSVKDLRNLPLAIAPLAEQHLIAEEIERHLSLADELEKNVEQSLLQSERLRQSILKVAYEGRLVPQDPNDEPAEKLLERIKAEKLKLEGQQKNLKSKLKVNLNHGV